MLALLDFKAAGIFVPAPTFHENDVPDQTGKVVVITGANTGLGYESARVLLAKGAKVYAACRSADKAEKAIAKLKETTGKSDIHYLPLDLSDITSAVQAGKTLAEQEKRLDVVMLSAGIMFTPAGSVSKQGLEAQFATNVIGHYAFVQQLTPLLIQTAKSSPPSSVRVVWVSSSAHYALSPRKEGIRYSSIEKNVKEFNVQTLYGQSKLGNVMVARSMANELKQHGILVTSLHPGNIRTELQRELKGIVAKAIDMILNPVELGALTQIYCATSPELTVESDSGGYFVPWARKHKSSHPAAEDSAAIEKLKTFVEGMIAKHSST